MNVKLHPPPFTWCQLEISYTCRDTMELPRWKGSLLRGGLGRALRQMLCPQRCDNPDTCDRLPACTYRTLFNPPLLHPHPDLRNIKDAPRPYTVRPPLDTQTTYHPGDQLVFGVTLLGPAIDQLMAIIGAWTLLGEMGLGLERGRASLENIQRVNPRTGERQPLALIQLANDPNLRMSGASLLELQPTLGSTVQLSFITPTHLKYQREPVRVPEAHHVVRAVLRRISMLSAFYGSAPWEAPFTDLIDLASTVPIRSVNVRWVDWGRTSGATNQNMNLGGIIGSIVYEQVPEPIQALFWLGAQLHIGKWAVFGNGWYRVTAA